MSSILGDWQFVPSFFSCDKKKSKTTWKNNMFAMGYFIVRTYYIYRGETLGQIIG